MVLLAMPLRASLFWWMVPSSTVRGHVWRFLRGGPVCGDAVIGGSAGCGEGEGGGGEGGEGGRIGVSFRWGGGAPAHVRRRGCYRRASSYTSWSTGLRYG